MPDTSKGNLIAFRSDRLGARLVSLMNAMRLAQALETDFRCAWIDTTGVGHVFNDPTELFKPGFVKRHFLTTTEWREARPNAENLSGTMQQDPDAVVATLGSGQDMIVGNAFGVIVLRGEDLDEVTQQFRAQFRRIPFAEPIAQAMRSLDKALAGHTAYHIRRGDLTDDPKAKHKLWAHKVVPNEFYEFHMARALSATDGGAIIFSDYGPSIEHYSAMFPSLKTLDDLIDTDNMTEAQRDLFELYAMSRCKTIIAPERSAFSSTAADLTGAEKLAITEAMDDEVLTEAHEALHSRLANNPESFEGDGHIGQALAHVGGWLERQDRWSDAADLFAHQVGSGLNISFIYPMTMRLQHKADDIKGVLQTARHMNARSVIYIKDQATSELLHGYAHLRDGDLEAARRHMINGFWHGPSVAAARAMIPMMVETNLLSASNFFPVTWTQMQMDRRRGPLKTLFNEFPALAMYPGIEIPKALGSLDAMLWDWAPLMRSVSFPALVRRGSIDQAAEKCAAMTVPTEHLADHDSQCAVLQAYRGETEMAEQSLTELTTRADATAMTWQRLSHVHWLARRFRRADGAAQRAVEMAPDWMAMHAWAGMTALRIREPERAYEHLTKSMQACPGLPSVTFLTAKALERLDRLDDAVETVQQALALAPLEVEYAMLAAELLTRLGRDQDGIACLTRLVDAQRAPGKLFVQLIEMLEKAGDQAAVDEMRSIAAIRAPKHPAFVTPEPEEVH